jgi:hypothetical protein
MSILTEPIMDDDLTKTAALEIARRSNCFGESRGHTYGQSWILADDMAARCVAETLRNGEGAWELDQRLNWAMRLIKSLQFLGRPTKLRDLCWKEFEDITGHERKTQWQ